MVVMNARQQRLQRLPAVAERFHQQRGDNSCRPAPASIYIVEKRGMRAGGRPDRV